MSQPVVDDVPQPQGSSPSIALATSEDARQRRKIAELEEKLQVLESGQAIKRRETNYYISKGRAIQCIVTLYDALEDLIAENDRRCDDQQSDEDSPVHPHSQECLQFGYIALSNALSWFHSRASELEYDEYLQMLKKLRQGADGARGDDTSKLKSLVADWVNRELKPHPPVDTDDKSCRGFVNDACGRLLCPTELDWSNPIVRAGIRDHAGGHVVTEMSWPTFMYEKYTANPDNLEEGLFKSSPLVQPYKAIFTSPSSAKEFANEGDGADIIANNRRASKDFHSGKKVKTHLRLALSSVTSWRSIDGDFDYIPFWRTIVDFFERPPGRAAQRKVEQLLAWWTRKVFGTSHRAELSDGAKANMSVNALARQRAQLDDAAFDSD
ncbi:uncharacterized protein F5891DRAFT_961789 [Suillus fuscotomentosus]|uniref:Uncharacterized protein n=1 Tax=Suillus fuscotomentosus TaxID=1912939 RepID=A0AAD4HFI3_9AGAM|nr:uncharacterized protein F5891DRAFT_961789 [Suillus fuscotomentosus]KAG1894311.1 hypothetical protein F5891DRAFT_961789 [Suillus fuscotomentosus]